MVSLPVRRLRRIPPFASLDFVYVPTADVDAAVVHYTVALGASLELKVRGIGATGRFDE